MWPMPKEKHEHSYGNSDREKTQQTNILHNSGSLQDMPRSQTTNSLSKYFMEGINAGILQKIFGQNPLPTMIREWYNSAMKFNSQHRRFQEILG